MKECEPAQRRRRGDEPRRLRAAGPGGRGRVRRGSRARRLLPANVPPCPVGARPSS